MAEGEYKVKVSAVKSLKSPPLKPYLRLRQTALRTAPVFARVVQDHLIVPLWTCINVEALLRRAARHHVPRCPPLPLPHWMLTFVGLKVITKYFLYDPCLHPAPALSSLRPCIPAIAPRHASPQILLPSHPIAPNCVTPAESSLLDDLISLRKTHSQTLPLALQPFPLAHVSRSSLLMILSSFVQHILDG